MTCILVERGFRGRGLAAITLRGAVEQKNSSFLYNGTRTMYAGQHKD